MLRGDSIDMYLVAQNPKPHSSIQSFEMQATRDLFEFSYINDSTNCEYLSKRVKMPPRTFRRNMKIQEQGELCKEKKGSGRTLQSLAMRKKRLCQIGIDSKCL